MFEQSKIMPKIKNPIQNPNSQISPNRRTMDKNGINKTTLLIFDLMLVRRSFTIAGNRRACRNR